MKDYWKIAGLTLLAGLALAGAPKLSCAPQQLRGIPGQPLQAELTIETADAVPVQLKIPSVSNLVLRTVEKIPIQRTETGTYVQKRVIIWQGVEAGSGALTNLTAVFQGSEVSEVKFPTLGITIDAVEPANPPRPAATPPMEGNKTSSLRNPLLRRDDGTAERVLSLPEVAT